MLNVWNQVKVKNPDHPRAGTAGVVMAVNPGQPEESAVKFDLDGITEVMLNADLEVLA